MFTIRHTAIAFAVLDTRLGAMNPAAVRNTFSSALEIATSAALAAGVVSLI
jgi:hypothetical protein